VLGTALVAAGLLVLGPLRRAIAAQRDRPRRAARWLLLGSLLALTPVLAVIPSPRLLGASMLGVSVAVALLLEHAWWPPEAAREPEAGRAGRGTERTTLAALLLGFAHLVHGPGTAWLTARNYQQRAAAFEDHAGELRARLDRPRDAELMVVRGTTGSFFLPFAMGDLPARWRLLSETGHALVLRRGPRALEMVVPPSQGVFPTVGNLFRDDRERLAAGTVVDLPGLRATVLEVGAEGPRRVRFDLDRNLEDGPMAWISEDHNGAFPEAALPKEGFGKPFDP
jgi:hypothetical protein